MYDWMPWIWLERHSGRTSTQGFSDLLKRRNLTWINNKINQEGPQRDLYGTGNILFLDLVKVTWVLVLNLFLKCTYTFRTSLNVGCSSHFFFKRVGWRTRVKRLSLAAQGTSLEPGIPWERRNILDTNPFDQKRLENQKQHLKGACVQTAQNGPEKFGKSVLEVPRGEPLSGFRGLQTTPPVPTRGLTWGNSVNSFCILTIWKAERERASCQVRGRSSRGTRKWNRSCWSKVWLPRGSPELNTATQPDVNHAQSRVFFLSHHLPTPQRRDSGE